MKEEIEVLRKELNRLAEEAECLYSDKILELSQRLDKLIYSYYKSTITM